MGESKDTLRLWMSRFDRIEAEYDISQEYLAEGRPQSADSVLQLIPQKFTLSTENGQTLSAVVAMVNILTNKDVNQLDSSSRSAIKVYADGNYGYATTWARNILMPYGVLYPLEYEFPGGFGGRSMGRQDDKTATNVTFNRNVLFIPNPAKDNAMLILPESETSLQFNLYDQLGRMVLEKYTLPKEMTFILDLSSFPQGVYYGRLSSAGKVLTSQKLMIQK